MANNETFEAPKAADSIHESKATNLALYSLERKDPGQSAHDAKQMTDSLVSKGVLPSLDLLSSPARTGQEASGQELKDAHIKCQKTVDASGEKSTTVEYPNNIVVNVSEGRTVTRPDGKQVQITGETEIVYAPPNHESAKHDGKIYDGSGKLIAQKNEDGSVTVDSGNGFYTQYPDGIRRESVLRSRDGKSWEVFDTNTPLGGLRPTDMTQHNHK